MKQQSTLQQYFMLTRREQIAVLWSALYYFSLLCSYYILRPLRDEMGITAGVEHLQWLFTGTFIVMLLLVPLFGWSVKRFHRSVLLPVVYSFFIINLLIFYWLFNSSINIRYTATGFYIWTSVFNLFVVSVFWSFMADLFRPEQAKHCFGLIAVGGSIGAIAGPAMTALLSTQMDPILLLLISCGFLLLSLICIQRLNRWTFISDKYPSKTIRHEQPPIGGTVMAGFRLLIQSPYLAGIALFILLFTTLSTFLYFEQAHLVKAAFDNSSERTAFFATIDLTVNSLTVLIQLLLTHQVIKRLGLTFTLALIPVLLVLGFMVLAIMPTLTVLAIIQVVRRAGNYALTKPAREILFTVLSREEKYKAKNVIDTVVYRGGDAVSGWLFAFMSTAGLSLSAIEWIAAPIAALWAYNGIRLGRNARSQQHESSKDTTTNTN